MITSGLSADDRVVLTTNGKAVPGRKGRAQGNDDPRAAADSGTLDAPPPAPPAAAPTK